MLQGELQSLATDEAVAMIYQPLHDVIQVNSVVEKSSTFSRICKDCVLFSQTQCKDSVTN